MKIACGFNPSFLSGLPIPHPCKMIEMGWGAYKRARYLMPDYDLRDISHSLHVNRSPITQHNWRANTKVKRWLQNLSSDPQLISIGFHLTGPTCSDIGKYGFSATYRSSELHEKRACAFINSIQDISQKIVWLENANFYSKSARDIWQGVESANRISTLTGCKQIIDLAHLWIDCMNNGVQPEILLGAIEWDCVAELHISGIRQGRDGTYHDAHGDSVHRGCWEMLSQVMQLDLLNSSTWLNIEHTDRTWIDKPDQYRADFDTLLSVANRRHEGSPSIASERIDQYAVSYIEKLISRTYSNFPQACMQSGVDQNLLLRSWSEYISTHDIHLSLQRESLSEVWETSEVFFADAFEQFFREAADADRYQLDRRVQR